jgi:phage N-6-adenine-methyltransferase
MSGLEEPRGYTLAECEVTIERGLETFVEVGQALAAIRDGRLYRESGYTRFEDYCRQRWGWSKTHANRQIEAACVAASLTPMGVTPASERQTRELAPLRDEPEKLREAWSEALERSGGDPTAKVVREVVRERSMDVHYSSKRDDWETPQDLFAELDVEFGFELDVCALPSSAKCEHYFTPEDDGLVQEWSGVCWMNPPYGDTIAAWMDKAKSAADAGATVVCLVPARVDTRWWWDYCIGGEVRFLKGRLKFGGSESGAPFPSAVVVLGPGVKPCVKWWAR